MSYEPVINVQRVPPEAFALAVMEMVTRRAARLDAALGATERSIAGKGAPLFESALRIAQWARTGEGRRKDVERDIEDVVEALFTRPIDGEADPAVDLDVRTDVGAVLAAARGRVRLAKRGTIPVKELAALAGIHYRLVQKLVADGAGVLRRDARPVERGRQMDADVTGETAIPWLKTRGVLGF